MKFIGSDTILTSYSRERILENLPLMGSIDLIKRIFEHQFEGTVLVRSLGLNLLDSSPIKVLFFFLSFKIRGFFK